VSGGVLFPGGRGGNKARQGSLGAAAISLEAAAAGSPSRRSIESYNTSGGTSSSKCVWTIGSFGICV